MFTFLLIFKLLHHSKEIGETWLGSRFVQNSQSRRHFLNCIKRTENFWATVESPLVLNKYDMDLKKENLKLHRFRKVYTGILKCPPLESWKHLFHN